MRNCSEKIIKTRSVFRNIPRSGIYHVLRSKIYHIPDREYIM